MSTEAVNNLITDLRDHKILPLECLAELLEGDEGRFPLPHVLTQYLVGRGLLTSYQADKVLRRQCEKLNFGHYMLLEPLGRGGMAKVYKARHKLLDKIVALKLFRFEKKDVEGIRRFRREIVAAAQLDHPNIVKAIDADQVEDTFCLVLEYVPGRDLARIVKEHGPLAVRSACDYIRQAAAALQHAHEHGMVHRDVKPSNLMLTWQEPAAGGDDLFPHSAIHRYPPPPNVTPMIKLLDLGLVRMQNRQHAMPLTQAGLVIGTPDYLAPEQARDSHNVDIRADLYSLGCTFYFLLSGRPPFPDGKPVEKLIKHLNDEPTPLERLRPDTPPHVLAIVRKLMAKRRRDRFSTPAAVVRALAPLLLHNEETLCG